MDEEIKNIILEEDEFTEEEVSFFNKCNKYFNLEEVRMIKRAFVAASDLHRGQIRESKEPYITHPLRVASILIDEIKLIDSSSVCAALLHDTIEDTGISPEFLEIYFNKEIADIVLGVTKIKDINLDKSTEDIKNNAILLRKVLNNPKIIIIKLADRLHNMRTLEYKNNPNSKKNKSLETLDFYVPIARAIGIRPVKDELEDLCFKFLNPSEYKNISNIRIKYELRHVKEFLTLKEELNNILENDGIKASINMETLNIYGIFKGMQKYRKLKMIPGLTTIKIEAQSLDDCEKIFLLFKTNYHRILGYKNNIEKHDLTGFQGLTFYINYFNPERLIKVEVSTKDMYLTNELGYASLINQNVKLDNTFFVKVLKMMSFLYHEDKYFYEKVNKSLLNKIYVFTPLGEKIWLDEGSTVKDFALKIHSEIMNNASFAYVNGSYVGLDYELKEKDVVEVIPKKKSINIHPLIRKKD